jgi:biofilm protein TabA
MKNSTLKIMTLTVLLGLFGCKTATDPAQWSAKKIDKWFEKGEWLNGWQVKPDGSINRKEFAVSYFKNKDRWDKAFTFLNNDLTKMEVKRYDLDGNNVYAPISEYTSKNEEDARFEAHQKYIDIQYVINGQELIGLAPLSAKKDVLVEYKPENDIEYFTVEKFTSLKADPGRFFIFFPDEAHRPGVKDGENSPVRKVVVKVKID